MNFCILFLYLNLFSSVTSNYFFDNNRLNGLTKQEWLKKCKTILDDTRLHQIVFNNINDWCTQLRCLKDNNEVYIGFDFCMRSSVHCQYSEPDVSLPFPECCPQRNCDGTHLMSFKKFMKIKEDYREEIRKRNEEILIQ